MVYELSETLAMMASYCIYLAVLCNTNINKASNLNFQDEMLTKQAVQV